MGWESLLKRWKKDENPKDKKGLALLLGVLEADLDGDLEPPLLQNWSGIYYVVPGLVVGVTPVIREIDGSKMRPLRFKEIRTAYDVDIPNSAMAYLAVLGYVRVYCNYKEGFTPPHLTEVEEILEKFKLERNLSVTPPVGRSSFIVRVASGEVYPEYYGPNWKDHIWGGYSRNSKYYPLLVGAEEKNMYIMGDCVLLQDFLFVDNGRHDYMLAVTQILLDAEMEKDT